MVLLLEWLLVRGMSNTITFSVFSEIVGYGEVNI